MRSGYFFVKFQYVYLTSESKKKYFFCRESNGLAILWARGAGTLEETHFITQTYERKISGSILYFILTIFSSF